MPYVDEKYRESLNPEIMALVVKLKSCIADVENPFELENPTNEQLLSSAGNINYVVSMICGSLMGQITYPKIAIITGVLENIKQEFYRRVASPYEDKKITQNGDIKNYKKI